MRREALILVFSAACASTRVAPKPVEATTRTTRAAPSVSGSTGEDAVCGEPWRRQPIAGSGVLVQHVVDRAIAPGVDAAQRRLCSCLKTTSSHPDVVRFVIRSDTALGQARVTAQLTPEDAEFAECLAAIVAHYPPFFVGSDVVDAARKAPPSGVVVVYPIYVDLLP